MAHVGHLPQPLNIKVPSQYKRMEQCMIYLNNMVYNVQIIQIPMIHLNMDAMEVIKMMHYFYIIKVVFLCKLNILIRKVILITINQLYVMKRKL